MAILNDFPKLHCPFIPQTFKVHHEDFRRVGQQFHPRKNGVYLAVNLINPGYEWVFDDPETFAVEKPDGTISG